MKIYREMVLKDCKVQEIAAKFSVEISRRLYKIIIIIIVYKNFYTRRHYNYTDYN